MEIDRMTGSFHFTWQNVSQISDPDGDYQLTVAEASDGECQTITLIRPPSKRF
jgi:hypothetical protein